MYGLWKHDNIRSACKHWYSLFQQKQLESSDTWSHVRYYAKKCFLLLVHCITKFMCSMRMSHRLSFTKQGLLVWDVVEVISQWCRLSVTSKISLNSKFLFVCFLSLFFFILPFLQNFICLGIAHIRRDDETHFVIS